MKPAYFLFICATTPGVSYFAFYEVVLIHLEQSMKEILLLQLSLELVVS